MASTAPSRSVAALSYHIELWRMESPDAVEKVLARAITAQLARAIFQAAKDEHPQRRITLRKGNRILADTSL